MARPRRDLLEGAMPEQDDSPQEAAVAPRPEFRGDTPKVPRGTEPVGAEHLERVGYGYHAERAAQVQPEEPTSHDLGAGQVLADRVTKFDARTGGLPADYPAGTKVSDLPRWLAETVVDTPGLTKDA